VLLFPLAVLLPASLLRRRRSLPVVLAAGLVIAGPVMGFCVPRGRLLADAPGGLPFRVLTCNMHYRRDLDPAPLEALVESARPDVVALQEWEEHNHSAILEGEGWHVHRTPVLFLASRFPIRRAAPLGWHSGSVRGAVMLYDLETPVGVVHYFSLHLASPRRELYETAQDAARGPALVQSNSDRRWEQADNLSRAAGKLTGPVVLAGDFNTPPESAIFRQLFAAYADAFGTAGWGWGYTFFGGKTMVRIDHVLAGPGWRCGRCRVGPAVGSPHRPVLADLAWQGG
jgi:endonuclease/exonuclease/phosphatase (EEP) superfamily protein YafD